MASFSFPPLLPPPVAPPPQVDAVTAVLPVALLQAELDALPLPTPAPGAQAAPVLPQPDGLDAAAMRPDQLMMARQLTWPAPEGGSLAAAWRGMVSNYGAQVVTRDLQARTNPLPAAALVQAGQRNDGNLPALRQQDWPGGPLDAWRFTVHAGGAQAQHLRVVEGEPEQQRQQRRRRARAALRLELVLDDGSVVTLQAEPVFDGIKLELCAPHAHALERLKALQPQLEAAVRRAGLRVLEWRYRDVLPEARAHLRLPSADAAAALSLPVFRAMAELALLLPQPAHAGD
ncbi:hypothetical protein [Massilia sp. 9096]|uniref:hypothetical protein n=1 Tax=Massilia sp. 9096 TaxID=1500894 RepID=UPI00056C185B|nr:hypothetical protein [Massilia sp. 9096]